MATEDYEPVPAHAHTSNTRPHVTYRGRFPVEWVVAVVGFGVCVLLAFAAVTP